MSSGEPDWPFRPDVAFLGDPVSSPSEGEDRSDVGAVALVADEGAVVAEVGPFEADVAVVVAEEGTLPDPGAAELGDVPVVADRGGGSCLDRGDDSPPRLAPFTTLERSAESLLLPLLPTCPEAAAGAPTAPEAPFGAPLPPLLPFAAFWVVAVDAVLVAPLPANCGHSDVRPDASARMKAFLGGVC